MARVDEQREGCCLAYDGSMPKILDATLAEHRERLRALLVDAAHQLLLDGGYQAFTFARLADRAGVSRPTIYTYFASKEALAVAVCEKVLPEWLGALRDAMAAADGPRDKVVAFVRCQLELAVAGQHRMAQVLADAPLGDDARTAIRDIHARFPSGLTDVLADLDVRRPVLTAALVQGVINAALQRITAGDDADEVIASAIDLALNGLTASA